MIKLIIADDQTLIREGISSMLNLEEDMEVLATGANGEEALKLYKSYKPDLILMDIRMPVLDGIEAVKRIRELDNSTKIIMLTTFDDEEYINQSITAGANGYLLKDTPIEDLSQSIRLAIKGIYQLGPGITEKLIKNSNKESTHIISNDEKSEFLELFKHMTSREVEIFKLLSEGLTNGEIAHELALSSGTVKNYISSILSTFDLKDRTQAALLALRYSDLMSE